MGVADGAGGRLWNLWLMGGDGVGFVSCGSANVFLTRSVPRMRVNTYQITDVSNDSSGVL